MLTHPTIRIGDTARFPLGRLGDQDVYRHRFAVTSFRNGLVCLERLHDGLTREVANHWFERYRTEETETAYHQRRPFAGDWTIDRNRRLAELKARRLQAIRLQTDPTQPGYYVSAVDSARALAHGPSVSTLRAGHRYALLLGPFVDHYTALQLVNVGRSLASPFDHWNEYGYGTCRTETSERQGRFNGVLQP